MNHTGEALSAFFERYRARGEPLVLATVAHTIGSTYRKAGAQMLIAHDGSTAGLLSGGCLEADLLERARTVLDTGQSGIAEYDTRSSDDLIWGIGLGCEGAMRILLTRLDARNGYQPLAHLLNWQRSGVAGAIALVVATDNTRYPAGSAYWNSGLQVPPHTVAELLASAPSIARSLEADGATFLIVPAEMPTRLLLLGAGPDAMPLVEIAGLMGWQVTVLDHRPAYAIAERFPRARRVKLHPANELQAELQDATYHAAVVMSHHLTSDQSYLAALADSTIPYIGLLGPAPRRIRLMNEIGEKSQHLDGRLYGPIGLDIGAKTPETIALAIVSEIQAVLAGRPGGSFSRNVPDHA